MPLEISQNALARAMGVPPRRIQRDRAWQARRRADTAVRLAAALGTSERFWLGLQADYDLEEATGCWARPSSGSAARGVGGEGLDATDLPGGPATCGAAAQPEPMPGWYGVGHGWVRNAGLVARSGTHRSGCRLPYAASGFGDQSPPAPYCIRRPEPVHQRAIPGRPERPSNAITSRPPSDWRIRLAQRLGHVFRMQVVGPVLRLVDVRRSAARHRRMPRSCETAPDGVGNASSTGSPVTDRTASASCVSNVPAGGPVR